MLPVFWCQIDKIVQTVLTMTYVRRYACHDIYNQNADISSQQESAKRKHPTNDALADLEYDLPRMKKSRLP
jgi:hypothetical protein